MKKKKSLKKTKLLILIIIIIIGILTLAQVKNPFSTIDRGFDNITSDQQGTYKEMGGLRVEQRFLTVNPYSRPGTKLKKVRGIVIHYTGNPGTTALSNRNYFEGLKHGKTTYASSHFIIGLDGEVIQALPLKEQAFGTRSRNRDTIAIECCHPNENGKFNKDTYNTLIKLSKWLCQEYNLDEDQVFRHYDITGKICPKYYVEHNDKWDKMKADIFNQ